jgi:transcriptional regulator of heat shock response
LKKLTLDHEFTPTQLKELNAKIAELLSENSFEEAHLLKLVEERDTFIQSYLHSCQPDEQKAFAVAEMEVNGLLVAYIKNLAKVSLKQLSDLIRGRKAVKKYR